LLCSVNEKPMMAETRVTVQFRTVMAMDGVEGTDSALVDLEEAPQPFDVIHPSLHSGK